MNNEQFWIGFAVGAASIFALIGVAFLVYLVIRPWIRLKLTGGRGSLLQILFMRFRGNPPMLIIAAYTSILHSGIQVSLYEVESQYVANRVKISTADDLIEFVLEQKRRESAKAS